VIMGILHKLIQSRPLYAVWLLVLGSAFAAEVPELPPMPPEPPSPPPRKVRVQPLVQEKTQTNVIQSVVVPGGTTNRTMVLPAPRTLKPYAPPHLETNLVWDALMKEYTAKQGETNVNLEFSMTNSSAKEITINAVRATCGCTVPKLPALPWKMGPQTSGSFEVAVDLRGKSGILTKSLTVETSEGNRYLTVRVLLPASAPSAMTLSDRARNLQVALADRQAVFKGDCAACHLQPSIGKKGKDLYVAICGVCHEAEHRASMVPNLRLLKQSEDKAFWNNIIAKGQANTLMPAFAISEAGPLSQDQINGLTDYLVGPFRQEQPAKPAIQVAPSSIPR
jgi:cytochrome c5